MNRELRVLAVLSATLLLVCSPVIWSCTDARRTSTAFSDRDYEVYAVVLRDARFNGRDFRGEMLMVAERTVDPRRRVWIVPPSGVSWSDTRKGFPEADSSTVAAYSRRNASTALLEQRFDPELKVSLLSKQEVGRFFTDSGAGWEGFYAVYPKSTGIICFSRIGFGEGGRQALVYVGRQSHWRAGAGYVVLLERDAGGWRVMKADNVWVS